jgi:hypothetical protein
MNVPADQAAIERFWSCVDKSGDCWNWARGKSRHGYGRFRLKGEQIYAHRFAFEITYGTVLPGLCICHTCDNPSCCNPKHLWVGTATDNMRDRDRKGRGRYGFSLGPKQLKRRQQAGPQKGTPEYRAMRSAATKAQWANPEIRAKMIAAHQRTSPEVRERRQEAARAAWARKRQGRTS